MNPNWPPIIVEEVNDPAVIEEARLRRVQFQRNSDWLQARIPEVYNHNRGKFICVAGQELFVADTPAEALTRAREAHPEDHGILMRTIPNENIPRVYAH
jgi:hypothetical protein